MIWYGGDYNPEQWSEDVWREDVRLMRDAGVTLVSVGIFAWSRLQPAEGCFDWGWLDRILDLLHAHGIAVDLATATASPPAWATSKYPEILPRDENGAVYWPGSRQHYSPTSPDYRRLAADLVRAIADRYAAHPAVALWHVNNELGCHLHYDYSDNARDAFRRWLRRRYETIEELNRAWGTDFWSQRYESFDQIVPPRKSPYSHNPAGLLDFRRFTSDALLELFVMEKAIIRDAGATQPVTTNLMGAFPPADYWAWADHLDVVSDDNYPDPNDPQAFRGAAFTRDLMRSLKPGVPWLLMEQATNAVNWRPTNAPKAPGQMAALSVQAIARGSDGVLFFQWRQSARGSEKFHSAMLPHAGVDTAVWADVVKLGRIVGSLPALPPGPTDARVALVFEWEVWWAIENPGHPVVLDYLELVQRWYAALHRQHIPVDIVRSAGDLSSYALVVAPHIYLLDDRSSRNLAAYVDRGGHLLVAAFSDVVDDNDAFRPGGFTVGLGAVLGLQVVEFGALVPPGGLGESSAVVDGPAGLIRGQFLAEEIRVRDAEVLGRYVTGRSASLPAFTTRRTGLGRAHYIATIPDDAGMTRLTRWALDEAGIEPVQQDLPDDVEVVRRGPVVTVINHGPTPVTIPVTGVDVLSGRRVTEAHLERFGWVMIRGEGG